MTLNYFKYLIKEILLLFEGKQVKLDREACFENQLKKGLNEIPVFIISYNRLSYIEQMIEQLEKYGMRNIHIIDNASTYPPLLRYYDTLKYDVIRMKENLGHMVFWKSNIFEKYRNDFFILTDPDLQIPEECPHDFLRMFFETLKKHPYVRKVGFSLKIDDLPDSSNMYKDIIEWEKQFHETYIKKFNIYYAGIDTTFALYMPERFLKRQNFLSAYRVGKPYEVRHLPWYKSDRDITEEDIYYSEHKKNGWSDPVKGFKPDERE